VAVGVAVSTDTWLVDAGDKSDSRAVENGADVAMDGLLDPT